MHEYHRSPKSKESKKETNEKNIRHTNKQATKQINKRTNKETKKQRKQTSGVACFFWSDAMAGAIACGQTKQIKTQQTNNGREELLKDQLCGGKCVDRVLSEPR